MIKRLIPAALIALLFLPFAFPGAAAQPPPDHGIRELPWDMLHEDVFDSERARHAAFKSCVQAHPATQRAAIFRALDADPATCPPRHILTTRAPDEVLRLRDAVPSRAGQIAKDLGFEPTDLKWATHPTSMIASLRIEDRTTRREIRVIAPWTYAFPATARPPPRKRVSP